MNYKVKLSYTVEAIVEAASMDDIQEWLSCTTPDEAKTTTDRKVAIVGEHYDEEVIEEIAGVEETGELIAAYEYEHNDGDQIWTDTTRFYKRGSVYYRTDFEGYYGNETTSLVDYADIVAEMTKVGVDIKKERSWKVRGGHSIIKDLV